jgi:Zn-dependent protease
MDINQLIVQVTTNALPIIFAITVHEAAHGYAARHFGDDTAWVAGRVTLNPVKHIDPVGTILMPLLLFFATSGAFMLGYAKPVPVRFDKLRNPRRDMIWVALAGPGSNLAQAFAWGIALYLLQAVGVDERFFLEMCNAGVLWNVVLFVFNLFPLPPLDGGRILVGLLPWRQAQWVARVEPWGFFIVIALIYFQILDTFWMRPLMALTGGFLQLLLAPFAALVN